MISDKHISLILPCLNEEKGLNKILKRLPKCVNEVIIIDGNSADKSVQIARKYKAKVIIEKKRGYGLALRTGFEIASNSIIATLDADATYPMDEIEPMFNFLKKNNVDFLVACRFPLINRSSMAVKNFFGNLLFSALISLFFNMQVTDVCSGMWLMKKETWDKIKNKIYDQKWFFSNEIKIEALLTKNTKYEEYWIELKERMGETKAGNPWISGLRILGHIIIKRLTTYWRK
ncbi:hypothetical protein A3C23_01685 [Candidatus Roizmanbacteria bacterium RIFCSPHIGHO2_02_FULL_37_13b]|uniref:Glycosyltransferase 2-like domain-containing protein n=1 Tax=Candidatus Roizmanbacteria bacterium RIFCSPLOWO2_02_FULL_36_11 TaxID=1802071 RepID=A0A1F7JCW1_9BACT|nr:MAG: hypothetical protein A3C23_01685 [Candidatus Roizmanbacteria bacterium RIFCSPHIGHO2_02_FULL_37_13b]OGK53448.1 MAG: hypothetical protein A3H78_02845 [Candidatus Roizmanbacteria bacterium RIFCSPLOWO2_02_FULL_36_11]